MGKKAAEKVVEFTPGEIYMRKVASGKEVPMVYTQDGRWLKRNPKGSNGGVKRGAALKLPELETLVSDIMGEEKIVDGVPRTAAYLILAAIRKKAVAGDVRAAELLLDRGYGKAKQEINVNKRVLQVIKIAGKEIEF